VRPRRAAAALQCRAQYRVADVGFYVERRAEFLGLGRLQPFIVDSAAAIRMYMTLEHLDVVYGVARLRSPRISISMSPPTAANSGLM
jgi:hypothetical protein